MSSRWEIITELSAQPVRLADEEEDPEMVSVADVFSEPEVETVWDARLRVRGLVFVVLRVEWDTCDKVVEGLSLADADSVADGLGDIVRFLEWVREISYDDDSSLLVLRLVCERLSALAESEAVSEGLSDRECILESVLRDALTELLLD